MKKQSPLERMFKRTRRAAAKRVAIAPVLVLRPYACVVLAIDPGETSGWAIVAQGKLVQWGEVNVFDHAAVAAVVAGALQVAEIASLPIVVFIEDSYRGETGASRPLWRKAASNAGIAARRVRKANASHWRSRFFGKGAGRWSQDVARLNEGNRARAAIAGNRSLTVNESRAIELGHDAAAAICIGLFAACSPIVGKVLPASVRRAAEAA